MLQTPVGIPIPAVQGAVRHSQQFGGHFHFQILRLDGVHHAFGERLLPELLPSAGVQVLVHLNHVRPLFFDGGR